MKSQWLSRRRLLCTVPAFVMASGGAWADQSQITVGFFELPPHAAMANGQPVGAAIDYFNLIAEKMGVQVTYAQYPLARLLKTPSVDMILLLGKTAERESNFRFSSVPQLHMDGSLAVRIDSPLKVVRSANDLVGLTIGVWDAGYLGHIMSDPRLTPYKMPSDTLIFRGLQMVKLKRLDAFYSPDSYATEKGIKDAGLGLELRSVSLPFGDDMLYSAFSRSSAPKYLERFEHALVELQKQTPYAEFLKTYLAADKRQLNLIDKGSQNES